MARRRVMFVTGTRAEFGLMEHALRQIGKHPGLTLQLVVTGMHLSREHGYSIAAIRQQGWTIDATVPWRGTTAEATGRAMAGLAKVYARLRPDVVLVVGDRVEAFAAAAAAHLAGCVVAHVHGGDRALGQVDDALRHAITKLAHLHFAATKASGQRILKLGEDRFRVHVVGTPGLDGLPAKPQTSQRSAGPLVILHPDGANDAKQQRQARLLIAELTAAGMTGGTIVYPNNDPGWRGIAKAWQGIRGTEWTVHQNLPRQAFLDGLANAAFLIGNSSSGIIEAASFGTKVINIGSRQEGRERSANVVDVPWDRTEIVAAISRAWNGGRPRTYAGTNVYGGGASGAKIAKVLATQELGTRLRQKLIAY
ncbi:MAG: UDP-N-acetylglucosamine 2-epimerase [Phycisphaerales bacterium]|nr:UDP-N-acetylglucosamine 2-epimerase [Phycisphaerales bacterium]